MGDLKFNADGTQLFCAFSGWTRSWDARAPEVEQFDVASGESLGKVTAPFDEDDDAPFIDGYFSHDGNYFTMTRQQKSNELLLYETQLARFRSLVLETEQKFMRSWSCLAEMRQSWPCFATAIVFDIDRCGS